MKKKTKKLTAEKSDKKNNCIEIIKNQDTKHVLVAKYAKKKINSHYQKNIKIA